MKTMIDMVCDYCGKDFKTPIEEYKRLKSGKKKSACCSTLCANKLRGLNNRGENNYKYNSVIKNCQNCGREYTVSKYSSENSKYCSKDCMGEAKSKDGVEERQCEFCGKIFIVKKSIPKKFCSKNCRFKNREKRDYFKCEICGKTYWRHQCSPQNSVCCSRECYSVYLSDIYTEIPEVKERLRKQGTKSHLSQKNKMTEPENILHEYLTKKNIEFIYQCEVNGILVIDFFLPEYNCCLEVYGDYWHANPMKYGVNKKPLSDMQQKNVQKDIRKYMVLTNKLNYNFYSLWEYDIKHDLESSFEKFLVYIDSKIRNEQVVLQ
jgi:G:T-mismatch repair DNA endonuclease (very short patch repair protein)